MRLVYCAGSCATVVQRETSTSPYCRSEVKSGNHHPGEDCAHRAVDTESRPAS